MNIEYTLSVQSHRGEVFACFNVRMFTDVEGISSHFKTNLLLILFCSVNLFRHVKVIQETLLLYRKYGVSINTNDLQRKVQIMD